MANKTFVSNSTLTIADNNVKAMGSSVIGTEIVKIRGGVTGVELDANFERVELSAPLASYTFQVISGTGFIIKLGSATVATIPNINQAVTIAFSDGSASLVQSASTTFKLGDAAAFTADIAAASSTPNLTTTDYSFKNFVINSATGNAYNIQAEFDAYTGVQATVAATGMNSSALKAVALNQAKIAAAGISGVMALTSGQTNIELTALFSKDDAVSDATVVATSMNSDALDVVAANSTKIAAASITGVMALTSGQNSTKLTALFSKDDAVANATVVATSMDAAAIAVLVTNVAKLADNSITGSISLNVAQYTTLSTKLSSASTVTLNVATGSDISALVGLSTGDVIEVTAGQNVTMTAAQAALAKIDTGGTAGTLTDSGNITVKTAAGSDISALVGLSTGDVIEVTAGQSVTMTAAQAALAKVYNAAGTTLGSAGVFTDAGNVTIKAATGSDVSALTGLNAGDVIAINNAAIVTLSAAQAALAKVYNAAGTTLGSAGVFTDAGNVTIKAATGDNLSALTGLATGDVIAIANGANVTLTPAQAALAKVYAADATTLGSFGVFDNAGVVTVKLATTGLVGAGISANGALTTPTVISGLGAGDKIDLSGLNIAALKSITTTADATSYLSGTTGNAVLIKGTYTAGGTSFAASASGLDELFVYDTNGVTAGGLESIVLLNSNAGIDSFSSDANGVFTFAGGPVISTTTGDSAAITTAFGAYTSGTSATVVATGLDAASVAVVVTNVVKIASSGITGSISLSASQFTTLTTALSASATLTVTDTSIAATVLTTMDTKSNNAVGAANVTTITGTAAEIAAVNAATGITKASGFIARPTAGSAAATDLTAIDLNNSTAVDASLITTVTGTATEVAAFATAETAATITAATNYGATVSGATMTVAQANVIDAANGTGVTTGSIVVTESVATLKTLTGTQGAYTIVIAAGDATSAAADLALIDAATTVAVNATAVTSITDATSANVINLTAAGITYHATNALTVTGGTGADAITLRAGASSLDTLVFNQTATADTIVGYVVANDSIQVSKAVYTAVGAIGALNTNEFESGAGLVNTATAAGRFAYNTTDGALYYDADGSGVGAAAVR